MNELAFLIKRSFLKDSAGNYLLGDDGRPMVDESAREVFCSVRSIGQKEYYEAHAADFRPELKIVLADYWDYDGETLADYAGQRYRIIRTYRAGQTLELTLERAPKEDGEANG